MSPFPPALGARIAERAIVSTFVSLRDPASVRLCAASGFEALVIDAEHAVMNPETVAGLVVAGHAASVNVVVRVGSTMRCVVQGALEAGADAVMGPMMESAAQAREFAGFCRYPPRGTRGFHPLTAGSAFGAVPMGQLADFANDRIMVIAQIETAKGLQVIEEIGAVEGVDMLFFGPGDMSLSLGVPPSSPALRDAMSRIAQVAHASGKHFGTFVATEEDARFAASQGAALVVAGADVALLSQGARASSERIRSALSGG